MRLLLCVVLTAVGGIGATHVVSICDLRPPAYDGMRISLSTRMLFTMHGANLLGDLCSGSGQHGAALLFPGEKTAPRVKFGLDPSAVPMLRPFFRTTGGSAIACAVLSGQVFYKKGFRLRTFGNIPIGNGFGENGELRTAFVLQSVAEIGDCK
jgi:hypothetical protein